MIITKLINEPDSSCNFCCGRKDQVIEFKSDDPMRRTVGHTCIPCAINLASGLNASAGIWQPPHISDDEFDEANLPPLLKKQAD